MSRLTYLRFPDEATARAATGWWSEGAGWAVPTKSIQFSVRGALYNSDGEYDEAGNVIKEPTLKDGYHIDVIYGLIPEAAQKFIINPSTPEYVLA